MKIKKEEMRPVFYRHILLIICLSIFSMSGCIGGKVKPYKRPDVDFSGIKKMAVLPFDNVTSDKYAAEKIQGIIIMQLLSRGIDVTEPGEVIRIIEDMKVKSIKSLVMSDINRIGKVLNVDAVMLGSVETYTIRKGITVSYPEVTVNIRVHDSATGNIIWSLWHTTGGASFQTRHFGVEGRTMDQAAKKLVDEMLDIFFKK